MKNILLFFAILGSAHLQAQYYYNDIVSAAETRRQMKDFALNKVRTISATGYDPSGTPTNDFSELQEIKENGKALKITTRSQGNNSVFYNRFDTEGRLINVIDSSSAVQNITNYTYDAAGKIVRVENLTRDTANDFNQREVHVWTYGADGNPARMWRIINNTDSLEIRFTPDENGNPGNEVTYKRGIESGTVYYYYDDKKRMTDIVRFNTRANRLLPDIMFEYDNNDRVIQQITTTSSLHLGYLIWRYAFDEKGLKTKEALFNKDKEMTGKIVYNYEFGQ